VSVVARSFVETYYSVLEKRPADLYMFYTRTAPLLHSGADGARDAPAVDAVGAAQIMRVCATLPSARRSVQLLSVNSQASLSGSILVLVSGAIGSASEPGTETLPFTQTFLLCRLNKGVYYVHNDMLRVMPSDAAAASAGNAPAEYHSQSKTAAAVASDGASDAGGRAAVENGDANVGKGVAGTGADGGSDAKVEKADKGNGAKTERAADMLASSSAPSEVTEEADGERDGVDDDPLVSPLKPRDQKGLTQANAPAFAAAAAPTSVPALASAPVSVSAEQPTFSAQKAAAGAENEAANGRSASAAKQAVPAAQSKPKSWAAILRKPEDVAPVAPAVDKRSVQAASEEVVRVSSQSSAAATTQQSAAAPAENRREQHAARNYGRGTGGSGSGSGGGSGSGSGSGSAAQKDEDRLVAGLWVGQLPSANTPGLTVGKLAAALREVFSKYGAVSRVDVRIARGYAFVDMDTLENARRAVAGWNEYGPPTEGLLKNHALTVRVRKAPLPGHNQGLKASGSASGSGSARPHSGSTVGSGMGGGGGGSQDRKSNVAE